MPFDVFGLPLDGNETYIRDQLMVDITGWAAFRHAIGTGTDSSVLTNTGTGPIPDNVKSMYCEFGPNHYHAICCLGDSKRVVMESNLRTSAAPLEVHHTLMSFYQSLGSVLDSLARIIYTLIVAKAATETSKTKDRYRRNMTDWGSLQQSDFVGSAALSGFAPIIANPAVDNVRNVRNALTHGWMTIARPDGEGRLYWPDETETERNIPWPHDPFSRTLFDQNHPNWTPISQFLQRHYTIVEQTAGAVFLEAVNHIPHFEARHQIQI